MLQFDSALFTWSDRDGSVEASDLGLPVGQCNPANFAVVSARTGRRREFYRQQSQQMDVQKYVTFDKLPTLTITIFND
jgi:hypothetical protein